MSGTNLKPEKLIEMAFALLDLADTIGVEGAGSDAADHDAEERRRAINSGQTIDQMAPLLASIASLEYRARGYRNDLLGEDLFGEPAWDMLLDLFIRTVEGKKTPVTSLCIASRMPSTTALRYINELEKRGMVIRAKSRFDQRTSYLSLSNEAFTKIGSYLRQRYSAFGFASRASLGEADMIVDPLFVDHG